MLVVGLSGRIEADRWRDGGCWFLQVDLVGVAALPRCQREERVEDVGCG